MPVHPVRLDESHRGRDAAEELVRDRFGRGQRDRRRGRGCRAAVAVRLERLEQAHEARVRGDDLAGAALEQVPPFRRDRVRVLEVVLEQVACIAGVEAVDVHYACCSRACYQSGLLVTTATAIPTAKHSAPMKTAAIPRRALRPPMPTEMSERRIAIGTRRKGRYATPARLTKIPAAARNPASVCAAPDGPVFGASTSTEADYRRAYAASTRLLRAYRREGPL